MNIELSKLYLRDISKLKVRIERQLKKCLSLLSEDIEHPSLHNKHIQCKRADNLYSIRVNKQYRVLYLKHENTIELYRLLDHDKYDRLIKNC